LLHNPHMSTRGYVEGIVVRCPNWRVCGEWCL
jgi:hypothetical protein